MNTHELKTVQPYFDAVLAGAKTAELRIDDRGFQVGDELILKEWAACPCGCGPLFTGRIVCAEVTHVLRDFAGLQPGWVMLSFVRAEER